MSSDLGSETHHPDSDFFVANLLSDGTSKFGHDHFLPHPTVQTTHSVVNHSVFASVHRTVVHLHISGYCKYELQHQQGIDQNTAV